MNLEYLAKVVIDKEVKGKKILYPDTLVGTDLHTTMINGLGVLGWGVGGIEAEAGMLGQASYFLYLKLYRSTYGWKASHGGYKRIWL